MNQVSGAISLTAGLGFERYQDSLSINEEEEEEVLKCIKFPFNMPTYFTLLTPRLRPMLKIASKKKLQTVFYNPNISVKVDFSFFSLSCPKKEK